MVGVSGGRQGVRSLDYMGYSRVVNGKNTRKLEQFFEKIGHRY